MEKYELIEKAQELYALPDAALWKLVEKEGTIADLKEKLKNSISYLNSVKNDKLQHTYINRLYRMRKNVYRKTGR
jgi:hypothetical protein